MTLLSLVIAIPFGIFSAIFLVEYGKKGNRFVGIIRLTTETLQGIPSIVYGLFGMLFFVTALGWGYSILAGAFTMSIMILPLIMRTTEGDKSGTQIHTGKEALGTWERKAPYNFQNCTSAAVPGIMAGVILAIGRIMGENCGAHVHGRNGTGYCGNTDVFRMLAGYSHATTCQVKVFTWIRHTRRQLSYW